MNILLTLFILSLILYYFMAIFFFFKHFYESKNQILLALVPYGIFAMVFIEQWNEYKWEDEQ